MNPNPGANSTDVPPFALTLKKTAQFWRNPQLFGRVLSLCLLVFGSVALELPGRPLLAQVACTRMERNAQGAAVKALQETLNKNGYNAGSADGIFGENTEIALKLFQRRNNLEPDGIVGPATCTALINLPNSTLSTATAAAPSPSPTGSTSSTVLKRGDTGAEVTTLQKALVARGFSTQPVNGVFDEATENTVKRLQLLEGLPVTGRVDAATKTRLNDYLAANPPTPAPAPAPRPANPVPTPPPPAPAPSPAPTPRPPAVSEGAQYRVVIPLRDGNLLAAIRSYVPSAVLDRNRLGQFVNAGNYSNRYDAESLSNTLKARGFDARVVRR